MTKNDHTLKACVYIHAKDIVSVNIYMDRRAYKKKVPKWLPFDKYRLE